jgi:hypothetical protein
MGIRISTNGKFMPQKFSLPHSSINTALDNMMAKGLDRPGQGRETQMSFLQP